MFMSSQNSVVESKVKGRWGLGPGKEGGEVDPSEGDETGHEWD
jgi:hypothetical protein